MNKFNGRLTFVSSVLSVTAFGTLYLTIPTLAMLPGVASAQSCYVDDRGRIVTRRRPGFRPIECPGSEAAPVEPTTAPVQQSDENVPEAPATVDAPAPNQGNDQSASPDVPANNQSTQQPAAPEAQLFTLPGRRGTPANEDRPGAVSPRGQRLKNPVSPIPKPSLADFQTSIPIPDRWVIVDELGYKESLWDPYNRNPLKADRPVGNEWFYNVAVISDSIVELRDVPTPVGSSSTLTAGEIDVFGGQEQTLAVQNVAVEFVYYKGDTVFRPPDHEFRLTAAFNINHAILEEIQGVNADPRDGETRTDSQLGIQAAFYDKHLRNVSDRYDFDSLRIGIQPFNNDFRGFLFQDNQFGVRLFGIRDNNKWQYNLAWFRRIEKDTNSGLNDLGRGLRNDDVFVANLYRQDWPVLGFISQASVLYNRNTEDEFHYNENEFIERPASLGFEAPRNYDVLYLGYSGDGHFGRLNVTTSNYFAIGSETRGVFVTDPVDISAFFHASELSMDFDWFRPRVSFIYASGDSDPFDDVATGFDAVFENPIFAGTDTSYWNRQAVPLIGGGRVTISGRNSLLNSLRSSKEEGQSNFTNPGLVLLGVGADMDLMPSLRLSVSVNSLFFDKTEVLEAARNQPDIDKDIGLDASVSLTYRPLTSQNIVLRGSYATLLPSAGFDDLFPDETAGYFFFNATLNY
ncbi:MAG: hypothetical protein AB8B64_06090 [Granulosicoccus sp.]